LMATVSEAWLCSILELLYQRRTLTRAEILEATGLNPASISQALRWLLHRGTLVKVGELASNGGRRAEVFSLNAEAAYFIGVDLEGLRIRFALTNMLGDIRYRWEEDLEFGQPLDVKKLHHGIRRLLAELDPAQCQRVIAIGVSYPGTLDEKGELTAVNLGWHSFPLVTELTKGVDLPIFLEPDKHSCILAERWMGRAQNHRSGLFLIVERGIGLGIFLEGKPVEGWHGMTGEIGHCTIDPNSSLPCACGRKGCLEAYASSPNIVRLYQEESRRKLSGVSHLRITDVFDRARQGDAAAIKVVNQASVALGLGLSHAVNLINPEIIVLGGDVVSAEDLMMPVIWETIRKHTWADLSRDLKLTVSGLGMDIRVKGAASLALRKSLRSSELIKKITSTMMPSSARRVKKHAG
jgi:glucokinase